MTANDHDQDPSAAAASTVEPTGPPADLADRPSIEPVDALPTDEQDEPGPVHDRTTDAPAAPAAANPAVEPTPPPLDPADRPHIEPTDGLPTNEQRERRR
jgi:hypothetical protein